MSTYGDCEKEFQLTPTDSLKTIKAGLEILVQKDIVNENYPEITTYVTIIDIELKKCADSGY